MVFILVFIYIYTHVIWVTPAVNLTTTGATGTNILRFDKSSSLMELRGRQ